MISINVRGNAEMDGPMHIPYSSFVVAITDDCAMGNMVIIADMMNYIQNR
jgi:hypothetical protein